MDEKTLATLIAAIITYGILAINTICNTNFEIPTDVLTSMSALIAAGIVWAISHYFNQDFTQISRRITPIMRKIKQMAKNGDLTVLDQIENIISQLETSKEEQDGNSK